VGRVADAEQLIDSSNFGVGLERRSTWRRFLASKSSGSGGTPQHTSGTSTDTELTTLDTHELWLPESEPPPSAMSALHAFGAEMLKLSRGLEGMAASPGSQTPSRPTTLHQHHQHQQQQQQLLLQHGPTPRRCSFRNGYAARCLALAIPVALTHDVTAIGSCTSVKHGVIGELNKLRAGGAEISDDQCDTRDAFPVSLHPQEWEGRKVILGDPGCMLQGALRSRKIVTFFPSLPSIPAFSPAPPFYRMS